MTARSGSSGGGGSLSSSSSSDEVLYKRRDTGGTGRMKDLSSAGTASLSSDGSEGSISRTATKTPSVATSSAYQPSLVGTSGSPAAPSGAKPIGTTVTQKPGAVEGPEGTVVTSGPRSDFSVVLAGQVGRRPSRSPARSNNFVSLIGGAGGLGRRAADAKRTLIGGA